MPQTCRHHPTRPAHFRCTTCDTGLCPECIVRRERSNMHGGGNLFLCPKCMVAVQWIGADNLIQPFWNRLPKFFLYPFSSHPLGLMLILAAISSVFAGPGLLHALVGLLIWGVLLKYSYAALQATAKGNLLPPKINAATISDDFLQVFKQLVLYFLIGFGFTLVTASFGILPGILFIVIALISVPAMIIILVTTDRLLHAINPFLFIPLATRIGWGYFLMYFFLILLAGAPAVLAHYAFKLFPTILAAFVFDLAKNYYTVISYHLMGYVILQYHNEIGYAVEFEDFSYDEPQPVSVGAGQNRAPAILDEIVLLLKDGRHDEALELLRRERRRGEFRDLQLSDYYYKLLKMKRLDRELLAHAPNHLNLLVQEHRRDEACEIFTECVLQDGSFTPSAGVLFKLGGWFTEKGKNRDAIGIYKHLFKQYPQDGMAPKALFRVAQLYNDRLMNPEKAKKILKAVLAKYPDSAVTPQIEKYLETI